jgi:hypothetical protein
MFEWILLFALAKEPDVKKWPEWECIRWTWTGDIYERRVVCLEWRKKDCSQRLHTELCKAKG